MVDKQKILGSSGRFSEEDPAKDEISIGNDNNTIFRYFQLFRFASKLDWILMAFGFLAAIGRGPSYFLLSYSFIDIIDVFIAESNTNELAAWNEQPLNFSDPCNATINGLSLHP